MKLNGLFGSPDALSLAGLPALTVAGVSITVAAAQWVYRAWEDYKNEKYKIQIERAHALYKQHLEKIPVFETHELQGFPPIFKFDPNNPSQQAESLHFTDEEIRKIGDSLSLNTDVALARYRQYVLNAILKLQAYYLDRVEENEKKRYDVKSGVLSYLLYMLEKKCLHFEGYAYDIAYLAAINAFILSYMSDWGTETSRRFSRLNEVHRHLALARLELEKHQNALSLEEMVKELYNVSIHFNERLIRCFVRCIVPTKQWPHVATATLDELSDNIIRGRYVWGGWGKIILHDKKIEITPSVFQSWLTWLIAYFQESLGYEHVEVLSTITMPEQTFILPDLQRLSKLRSMFIFKNRNDRQEYYDLTNQINSIKDIFYNYDNFLTMKLDLETRYDTPQFIHVSDEEAMLDRSLLLVHLATLMHEIISLQYLCAYLLNSIKQLGEIYMRSPQHFIFIFSVLDGLCNHITNSIKLSKTKIEAICRENQNISRLSIHEQFPADLLALLSSIDVQIESLSNRIEKYRTSVNDNPLAVKIQKTTVKEQMLGVAKKFSEIYHLPRTARLVVDDNKTAPTMTTTEKRVLIKGIHKTFWQRHYKPIITGILLTLSVIFVLLMMLLSICSGGALSLIGAILGGCGAKVIFTGWALAGLDALLGLGCGVVMGSIVSGLLALFDKWTMRDVNKGMRLMVEETHVTVNQALNQEKGKEQILYMTPQTVYPALPTPSPLRPIPEVMTQSSTTTTSDSRVIPVTEPPTTQSSVAIMRPVAMKK